MAGDVQRWCIGIDFGKRSDRTAIAAVQLVDVPGAGGVRFPKPELQLRFLERLPVELPYPVQCSRIAALIDLTSDFAHAEVAVDATGVGIAVADMLREVMRRPFTELTISSGARVLEDGSRVSVPKRDLASVLAVVMQQGRLRVAEALPDAVALYDELGQFEVKVSESGHDSYEAKAGHDDLVLATAYAVWLAERGSGPGSSSAWVRYLRRST